MLFTDILAELDNGRTLEELEGAVRRVTEAVQLTRKQGSIQLTVHIKPPDKQVDSNVVFLRDQLKVTVPEFDRASKIFFVDGDNNLVRDDPRQRKMPFAEYGER